MNTLKSKKIFLSTMAILFAAMLFTFGAKSSSAIGGTITLTPSTEEYTNQLSVNVQVDHSASSSYPSYGCYMSGSVSIDAFSGCKKDSSNAFALVEDGEFYTGNFLVNAGGTYTVYVQHDFPNEKSIQTINIANIDATGDKIILTQRKFTDKLKNIVIDIEFENTESPIIEVKYAASKRDVADLREYGKVLENFNQLVVSSSGIYTVYVKDAAGNENVEVITIANSTLVNGQKKQVVSPANQLTYLVKNNNGTYYIELPKSGNGISYSKDKVIVLSLYDEQSNTYKALEKTQGYKSYIILSRSLVSDLKQDRYIIKIDPSIIAPIYVENETYVIANYLTKKEAKRLGYSISLIDKNTLLIGAGIAAILGFIFILGRIRIKRSSIDD
ncbi:MAG: hypothetical protein E7184_01500 [Erysipelotrichaceae bacterium]|nr:hypothetical protein [Erysipelotrichaceae bacterium]